MENNTSNWEVKLGPDCQALECQFLAVSCHKARILACSRSLEWCQCGWFRPRIRHLALRALGMVGGQL